MFVKYLGCLLLSPCLSAMHVELLTLSLLLLQLLRYVKLNVTNNAVHIHNIGPLNSALDVTDDIFFYLRNPDRQICVPYIFQATRWKHGV